MLYSILGLKSFALAPMVILYVTYTIVFALAGPDTPPTYPPPPPTHVIRVTDGLLCVLLVLDIWVSDRQGNASKCPVHSTNI